LYLKQAFKTFIDKQNKSKGGVIERAQKKPVRRGPRRQSVNNGWV